MNGTGKTAREVRLENEIDQLRSALHVALAYATEMLPADAPTRADELAGCTATLLATGPIGRNFGALKASHYTALDAEAGA